MSAFAPAALAFDYRLKEHALGAGVQSSRAAVIALQRRSSGPESGFVRLEIFTTAGGPPSSTPTTIFVTLARDGVTSLPRASYTMPISAGDAWIMRAGGFATTNTKTTGKTVQDFDDLVLDVR